MYKYKINCCILIYSLQNASQQSFNLELVTAMSTEVFCQLCGDKARRDRPFVIYCDNGTNFVGSSAALKKVNWKTVVAHHILHQVEIYTSHFSMVGWNQASERSLLQRLDQIFQHHYFLTKFFFFQIYLTNNTGTHFVMCFLLQFLM